MVRGRVQVCSSIGVMYIVLAWTCAVASADRAKALLVADPQVSVSNRANADQIYSSIIAGLHDGIKRQQNAAERQFARVFTERGITEEQKRTAPIVLFAEYSSKQLDSVLSSRFKEAQGFMLARFLEIAIAELSPSNYEVTLTMYQPGTPWTIVVEKRLGGCNETLDELSARAREVADKLIEPQSTATPPQAKLAILPPAKDNTYLVGTQVVLDSCGIDNPSGDQLTVTWVAKDLLRARAHRRRLTVVLDHAGVFPVTQFINNDENHAACEKITVVEAPRPDPVVETCAGTSCKEALRASYTVMSPYQGRVAIGNTPVESQRTAAMIAQSAPGGSVEIIPEDDSRSVSASSQARDLRVIRIEKGVRIRMSVTRLTGQDIKWTQLSGPELPNFNTSAAENEFEIDPAKTGYYVFKVALTAAGQTNEAKVSFLAAPPIHADAGRKGEAKVGEPVLLDGSASYDVLGDQIAYTWVILDPDQQNNARIIDNHASQPRFIADQDGTYKIRLYVRVARKIDDSSLVEISSADTEVKVTATNFHVFLDAFGSATTPQVYRIGVVYDAAIAHFNTIARTFSYRRVLGLVGGLSSDRDPTLELMGGFGLRMHSRFLLDLLGRLYTREKEPDWKSIRLAFGLGTTLSISITGPLWLQLKGRVGPPPLYSPQAPQRFAWEAGVGLAYEH